MTSRDFKAPEESSYRVPNDAATAFRWRGAHVYVPTPRRDIPTSEALTVYLFFAGGEEMASAADWWMRDKGHGSAHLATPMLQDDEWTTILARWERLDRRLMMNPTGNISALYSMLNLLGVRLIGTDFLNGAGTFDGRGQ